MGSCSVESMVSQMSRTVAAANRCLVALMEKRGVRGIAPSHGDILMQLFSKGSLPMAGIAAAIDKDPSTVTALVKKLIDAGYVEKSKNAADRRVIEVRLTEAGRALERDFSSVSRDLVAVQMRGVSEEECASASAVLERIRANFAEAVDEITLERMSL